MVVCYLVVSVKKLSSASVATRGWGLVGVGEVWEKLVSIKQRAHSGIHKNNDCLGLETMSMYQQ